MATALYFAGGLVLLYAGGEGLVRAAASLGVRFGMTPLVAGLTIVAFATSMPELAVAVGAALRGAPGLAVGNVVGSNICNIALILGITVLIKPPRLKEQLIRRDVLVMVLSTLLVPGLLLDGTLSRVEGALLTTGIACYVWLTVRHAHKDGRVTATPFPGDGTPSMALWPSLLLAAASLLVLILGGELFVDAAVRIALTLGVPPAVVGLSATAFGTSLPELTASVIAARHGHAEMAAGNLIGSNIFNLLLILGVTSLVVPLSRAAIDTVDLGVMIGVSLLALALMVSKPRVERIEASILILIYGAYMAWLFA